MAVIQAEVEVEPLLSQPVASQPLLNQPVASQPLLSQPVASQPLINQPVENNAESVYKKLVEDQINVLISQIPEDRKSSIFALLNPHSSDSKFKYLTDPQNKQFLFGVVQQVALQQQPVSVSVVQEAIPSIPSLSAPATNAGQYAGGVRLSPQQEAVANEIGVSKEQYLEVVKNRVTTRMTVEDGLPEAEVGKKVFRMADDKFVSLLKNMASKTSHK